VLFEAEPELYGKIGIVEIAATIPKYIQFVYIIHSGYPGLRSGHPGRNKRAQGHADREDE
jgi:hypothetical protein